MIEKLLNQIIASIMVTFCNVPMNESASHTAMIINQGTNWPCVYLHFRQVNLLLHVWSLPSAFSKFHLVACSSSDGSINSSLTCSIYAACWAERERVHMAALGFIVDFSTVIKKMKIIIITLVVFLNCCPKLPFF